MNLTRTTEAVLLLTTSLNKRGGDIFKPLTPAEWGEFAAWLKDQKLVPGDLLQCDLMSSLKSWEHQKVTSARVQGLLNRGAALGFALEKWARAGLWVVTRADTHYPSQLKQRLGRNAPAVIFGCGDVNLLNLSSIAIVGSRHADESDLFFAKGIGRHAAECGEQVVSGGAAGVDRAAMFGALDAEGTAVGVLAENLLRATTSNHYRHHLLSGSLALVSTFDPEARFTVANAMARNKYIYCFAHDAIVVSSEPDQGGTWGGAIENLNKAWVPLAVKRTESAKSGNAKLVELGGRWLDDLNDEAFGRRSQGTDVRQGSAQQASLFRSAPEIEKRESSLGTGRSDKSAKEFASDAPSKNMKSSDTHASAAPVNEDPAEDLYAKVRSLISALCMEPKRTAEIADALGVTKPTADAWINRLVQERALRKVLKPVRYVTREKDLLEKESPKALI